MHEVAGSIPVAPTIPKKARHRDGLFCLILRVLRASGALDFVFTANDAVLAFELAQVLVQLALPFRAIDFVSCKEEDDIHGRRG